MNWYDKILFSEQLKIAGIPIKEDNNWDKVYIDLERKLGRKPESWEVQEVLNRKFDKSRILEPV
ncbi:hypothetical protein LCGC14_1366210 [marine sediment metagenome]|uniref:Uncharacterized protein n=1 Tax=marine sediment metagenome TaxID=412755 RepID=A0A0F9N8R7_9ZZZZ